MVKIKYKLLPGAKAPFRASKGASGWDLHFYEPDELFQNIFVAQGYIQEVRTGLFVEVPKGYELQVRPRSGLAKNGVTVVNTPGTVDSDYRGEIIVLLTSVVGSCQNMLTAGDRIAQAVICPVPEVEWVEVDELSESERGEKGYGSTGL